MQTFELHHSYISLFLNNSIKSKNLFNRKYDQYIRAIFERIFIVTQDIKKFTEVF